MRLKQRDMSLSRKTDIRVITEILQYDLQCVIYVL